MLLEEGRLDLQVLGQGNKLQAVAATACYGGILSSSSVSEDCVKCLSSSPASSSQLFLGSTASINDNDSIGAIVRFAAVESPGRLSSSPESSSNSSSCCTASFSDCTNIHPTITLSPTTIEAMSNSMTSSSSNPAGRDRKGSLNMAMTADYSASSSSTNWWNNILMPSPSETGHPHLFLNSQQASPEPADEDSALPDQSSAWYQVLLQNQHSGVSNGLQDILCSQNDLPFQPELGSRISTANMQTWEEQQQQQQPPPMAVSNFTFNGNDMNLPMNSSCSHKSNLVTAYPYHQSSQSFTTTMAMDNNHNWQTSVKLTTPTTEANLATTFNESKMVSLNKSRLSVPCTAFSGGILTDFVGFPRQVKQEDHSNFIYNTNESKHGLLDSSNIITRWPLPLGFPNTPNSSQVFGLGGSNINYNLPLESKLLRSICHEAPTVAMDRNQAANQRDFKPSSNGIRNSTMQGEEIMQNSQHRMIPCDDSPLALKRQRLEPSTRPGINLAHSSKPPVRKEKLGDRISALQQLVSPFGKTDTASVLLEAMSYIRFLHEQVQVLSTPYIKSPTATNATSQTESGGKNKEWGSPSTSEKSTLETGDEIEPKHDLRSRGLCLVPVSCTMHVANEFGSDYWAPPLGGRFR